VPSLLPLQPSGVVAPGAVPLSVPFPLPWWPWRPGSFGIDKLLRADTLRLFARRLPPRIELYLLCCTQFFYASSLLTCSKLGQTPLFPFHSLSSSTGLSRVRTFTSASAGRSDASDDSMDIRQVDGHPSVGCRDRRTEGPTALRSPEGVAVRWTLGPSSKANQWRQMVAPSAGGRPLSMTPISPFYTMCLLL
jgi:hypothetical protein